MDIATKTREKILKSVKRESMIVVVDAHSMARRGMTDAAFVEAYFFERELSDIWFACRGDRSEETETIYPGVTRRDVCGVQVAYMDAGQFSKTFGPTTWKGGKPSDELQNVRLVVVSHRKADSLYGQDFMRKVYRKLQDSERRRLFPVLPLYGYLAAAGETIHSIPDAAQLIKALRQPDFVEAAKSAILYGFELPPSRPQRGSTGRYAEVAAHV